jgi:hypothetical protein
MMRMDNVPALRNRYANIVRQYEEELASALAIEAGKDPKEDLYSQLMAATLLSAIVASARWHSTTFGPDTEGTNASLFAKMILARFPSRAEIDAEKLRMLAAGSPRAARARGAKSAAEPKAASPRKSKRALGADAAAQPVAAKRRPAKSRSK